VRLASYEYAKSPLPPDVGREVCFRLGINQRWLATGRAPMKPCFDLSPNLEYQVKPRALFSHAYREVLSLEIEERFRELEAHLGVKTVISGDFEAGVLDTFALLREPPANASAFYVSNLRKIQLRWLPEPLCFDFAKALMRCQREFYRKHKSEIERLVSERLRAQDRAKKPPNGSTGG
jgi:hypothetical protein